MRILIASDKFKGSMTASEACRAIADGLTASGPESLEVRTVPVADGGEGMASALTAARGGEWLTTGVRGPLGEPVTAGFGVFDDGETAAIEMAEASGLFLLEDHARDPRRASTFGTGQLIEAALSRGVGKIILGIGGSATNDGGTGMAEALGFRFLDESGRPVTGLPENLERVRRILSPDGGIDFRLVVACDVLNPLLGPEGCTRVYGPQKGIAEDEFERHEERLRHLVELLDGEKWASVPGAGAAGGLGFGCLAFLRGELSPGFDLVAEALDLESSVRWADWVITGEGKLDGQSLQGKAPAGVAKLARKHGKRTGVFCGVLGDGEWRDHFDCVWDIDREGAPVEEAIRDGKRFLEKTAARVELV